MTAGIDRITGTGPRPSRDLHLDFETYCELDLRKVGIRRYVRHPSFKVLCVAWCIDGGALRASMIGATLPPDLVQALKSPDVQAHAWNAAFESEVLEALGIFAANPIECTMQRALAYGLPARLETAGKALKLAIVKDAAGHRLMLRLTKPDKKTGLQPVLEVDEWQALTTYCAQDVRSEMAIAAVIPRFGPEERALAELDADMNRLGIGVDLGRVHSLMAVAGAAEAQDAMLCAALTQGAVTSPGTQTARLGLWLRGQGLMVDDVARATVEDALDAFEGTANWPVISEVLRIRLRAARGSTKKLKRMTEMAWQGRLHWQFQFCGAGRTGRWSGRGIQPQNLPRVKGGFSPDLFTELADAAASVSHEMLDAVSPANVLDCVAWSLRSCLVAGGAPTPPIGAAPELLLWSFDFSQIEARVLAWLAGQQDVLSVFRRGEDVYVWAAARFGSTDRQLGKVLILALGYGMGAAKLQETARKSYGVPLTLGAAESFKASWRAQNAKIVGFWYDMEAAARLAIVRRGQVVAVGGSGIAFQCTARTLQMRLPSGRILFYHTPRVDTATGTITYWGTDVGGNWVEQKTYGGKLAENATQAVARDIMSEAMLRVKRRARRTPTMTVHDELVYLLRISGAQAASAQLEALCLEAPPWAGGLPIAGESKLMVRYGVKTVAAGP